MSLVASRDSLNATHLIPLQDINANYIALMPFAFLRNNDNPELIFNAKGQWFGEKTEGIDHSIKLLQKKNLKVMIKPQIWIKNGEFTGDLSFEKETDWIEFEASYRDYILLYVEIAEENNVALFCVGTELYGFVKERQEFWNSLIEEIRLRFSGKLVYAENWDKVDKIDIWKKLDYIGADAYFPLSEDIAPTNAQISEGWQPHKKMLKKLSKKFEKPILFTEFGYRSMDYALKEPWKSERGIYNINLGLQARALEVTLKEFWGENWFAGGFLWKWHQNPESGGLDNDRFTPQNKPAENIIKEYYSNFGN